VQRQLMGGIVLLASQNGEADVGRMEVVDGAVLETDSSSCVISKALFPSIIWQKQG
jgi:hypothetical protein